MLLGLSAAVLMAAVVSGQAPPQAAQTVVRGGTLIDVRTGALQPNSVIVISGERITAVGPAGQVQAPAGATVVDATGKFVMPGLWDSHVHTRDYDGELNINHGVTSTMDMGNLMDWIAVVQEAREKQLWVGPRIFFQGMSIGGSLGPHQWNARDVEQAVDGAKRNIAAGSSFLKVYANATVDMIRAVTDVANAEGINVTGHLGRVDAREAILAGLDGLAHGRGIPTATAPPDIAAKLKAPRPAGEGDHEVETEGPLPWAYADPAKFDEFIKFMVDRNVRLEPNFVQEYHGAYPQWNQYQVETQTISMLPELHYLREKFEMYMRMWYTDFPYPYPPSPKIQDLLKKALANQQLFTRKFAEAGGKLFIGTDNYYHAMAGLAVWHEMELQGAAGVAPLKILQAATINPAEFVRQDKNLGTIESGKIADLIVLGRNPLQDIKNIRSLETVIQHGKVQPLGYKSEYRMTIPRPYLPVNGQLPRPHITSVSPVAVPMGSRNVVLTIKGTNFNQENRVLWDDLVLPVLQFSPTELRVAVPDDALSRLGTWKVHMITGGRVQQESENFQEVMVTAGKRIDTRYNGTRNNTEF
jgi:imidazolonepropionase-like amidohydrolase